MKKHILLAAAFAALSLASCKKDEAQSNSQKIVGTWTASYTAADANGNKAIDASEKVAATGTNSGTLKFESNGTVTATSAAGTFPLSWKINNNTELVLSLAGLGSDTTYIKTLTSNELVLESRDSVYSWAGFTK